MTEFAGVFMRLRALLLISESIVVYPRSFPRGYPAAIPMASLRLRAGYTSEMSLATGPFPDLPDWLKKETRVPIRRRSSPAGKDLT